jgi:uncharacterized protein with PQ loop repeat
MSEIFVNGIGWIGAILFAICGIPQAYQCYKQKHAHGLSWPFLLTWFGGEVLTLVYIFLKPTLDIPLVFNYVFNLLALLIIFYYKSYGINVRN